MSSRYDVVIVGSGPVGTAIARELSDLDPALRLVVLEAGPVLGPVPGGHVKNIADPAARAAVVAPVTGTDRPAGSTPARPGTALVGTAAMPNAATSTNVGGMGAHWTCACPRPGDDEMPDFVDLDEALDRAEELMSVTTAAFERAPLIGTVQKLLGERFDRPGRRAVGSMPVAVATAADGSLHWTGPAVIAGDLWSRPNVTLLPSTLARRILHADGTATGVEIVAGGERSVIGARAVVVAGDALRTPQLLWASGIRPAALGRYLNDQPQVMAAALLSPADVPDISASELVPVSGVSWVPYAQDRPFHGQVMQLDASPVPLNPGVTVRPGQVVGLGWFCKKEISADDRVWFDDAEPDGNGMPAIRIDYRLTETDHAAIAAAKAEIAEAAAALGTPLGEPFVMPAGSSLHYQGTTRSGPVDDGTSVCDPAGRVWRTTNVYVGGNNVIPSATACNPTLTAVAFGVLTARALRAAL